MNYKTYDQKLKIGLAVNDLLAWQGGRELFKMFYLGLCASGEPPSVVSTERKAIALRGIARAVINGARAALRFDAAGVIGAAQQAFQPPGWKDLKSLLGNNLPLYILRPKAGVVSGYTLPPDIDVIGPVGIEIGRSLSVPWFGYIYDCQHRSLPSFFSEDDRKNRDAVFAELLSSASVVVVNSRSVKEDIERFFAPYSARIVELPFAASPDESWFDTDIDATQRKYRLKLPYFLCSNQFWQHKNHRVVVDAAVLALHRGSPIQVVFTGAHWDYRNPSYATDIIEHAKAAGVAENCHFLGHIPKLEQIALMRGAIAVVQPTLCEGGPGGGAIYNAIALGRPTIVSDIPVNREIETEVTAYFSPLDPASLLAAMQRIAASPPLEHCREELIEAGRLRLLNLGRALRGAATMARRGAEHSDRLV